MRRVFWGLSLIGLLFLTTFSYYLYQLYHSPMLAPMQQPVIFTVNANQSAAALVKRFTLKQWVRSPWIMRCIIRILGYDRSLRAGVYRVEVDQTAMQFLQTIVDGGVLRLPLRIREGTTYLDVQTLLNQAPYLSNKIDWSVVADKYPSPEGLLLADTFYYDAGSSSTLFLEQANRALLTVLDKSWKTRDKNLPYRSAYELLIAASIIEKEASIAEERRIISGVIVNRLNKHMRLQMDPTVIYALGHLFVGKLTYKDLKLISPYNTYMVSGLPPTPIAMVSKDAIDAAAHPQMSTYLYYVAKGDGSHQFSTTYSDQKQAIKHIRITPSYIVPN